MAKIDKKWMSTDSSSISRASTLKKDKFIDVLSEYSFNVPTLEDRSAILKEIGHYLVKARGDKIPEYYGNATAVIFSTAQISEFSILSPALSDIISGIFSSKGNSKFLDYVISSDWGKFLQLSEECRQTVIKQIIMGEMYKKSDELAALILKIAATTFGGSYIRNIIGDEKLKVIFLDLITAIRGRSGGLLRNAAFLTRREPEQKPSPSEFPAPVLAEYLRDEKLDSVTRFSIVSMARKCFYLDLVKTVRILSEFDRDAATFCLMTMSRPFLVWSAIQRECLALGATRFPGLAINNTRLNAFYQGLKEQTSLPPAKSCGTVGLIITTYNPDLELIKYSIESLLRQTYQDIRICIVDDCSSTECYQGLSNLVSCFKDDRIILKRNEINVGQYVSRNLAIQILGGVKFFAIQDDDDFSHPERIALQVHALSKHPEAMLVMCKQARFSETMQYVPDKMDPSVFDPSPASSFFRSELIHHIGGFSDVRSRGDVEFLTRIRTKYGAESVYVLDAVMYLMRCTPETVSASKDRLLKTQIDVFRRHMASNDGCITQRKHHALHK